MKTPIPALGITAAALFGLGGCATLVNDQASDYRSTVNPVMTEHSLALSCLGELIDRSGKPVLTVFVDDVPDTTVPRRFDERRLSSGGAWWLHTAIDRLGTDKVRSADADRTRPRGNHIVLEGAWTQDDADVGRGGADASGRRRTGTGLFDLGFGLQRRTDLIAGDFMSSRGGHVLHASAISVAVNAADASFGLRIQDGRNTFGIELGKRSNDGPQFAQRRIAEAAVMVHVARAFDVDYAPCIELSSASPASYAASVQAYGRMLPADRHRAVQQALARAGHPAGAADGVWGEQSARALMRFQAAHRLPVTGRHSAEIYATLLRQADAPARR